MARSKRTTETREPAQRVKTSIHFEPEVLKLLKIGSIETGLDMSDLVNAMVKEKFAGWHIRKGRGEGASVSVNSPSMPEEPPTVRINTALNRINQIHNRSVEPLDRAIDTIADD